jgi:hypothetical protein
MFKETDQHSEQHAEHASGCGCGSHPQPPVAEDQKAASEQEAADELVRARNKLVRAPSKLPGAAAVPPFSNHSGSL